jgi:tetratricopeptide (TPR) repeat protein
LSAYAEGLGTADAIRRVCGVERTAFEDGYRSYVREVAAGLQARPLVKSRTFLQLQEAHEKDPDNAETASQLAEQFLLRQRNAEARKLAERVLARHAAHPLASYVRAQLLLAAGDQDEARKTLESAVARAKTPEPKVLRALGNLQYEEKNFSKAVEMFELGRKAEPYDNQWLTDLVKTYAQAGEKEKQAEAMARLLAADPDDLDGRKQLTRLLLDLGRPEDAERWARQALEIDVLDGEAQRFLGDVLLVQKKYREAIAAYQAALEIDEKADETRLRLAQAYLENGDRVQAENQVTRVLTRDPKNIEGNRLKKLLDK